MIPKIIHYCWFGGTPLPASAEKCIASWRKYFPDYEIREWSESDFDVDETKYTRQAYQKKKYAFVSDYARFKVLHEHGGIYFDTDVEVIAPMEDIIARGAFMGIEKAPGSILVNSGLGLALEAGSKLGEEILDYYRDIDFVDSDGNQIPGTVVKHVSDVLKRHGFVEEDRLQHIAGITIYPHDYFNPLDDATGSLNITPNTRSIHWYSKTWCDGYGPVRIRLTRLLHRVVGLEFSAKLKSLLRIK